MSCQSEFYNYVRGSSFRIDLSERMISALFSVNDSIPERNNLNMHPYFALSRRGLIYWIGQEDKKRGPYITDAGRKVVELLEIAGYRDER